ncbi:DUF3024 domain-containing protein [Polaromonas naphthalenivorans]|uniref:DUF3024 domain-containing protein n=1 Tax=Polaromonas naphthalenivorans (strain CJ2) TaxID=365044 RepID=A1VML7_POLNA|nr:hypothetical protein [Polaromonas naphthalenivorans]ABM36895.1 conserved hypothetical protein [Polaromonas naphthalenivorans CJ2]
MNTARAVAAPAGGGPVADFMQHRVEKALRERVRYRYVQPLVLREGDSFRIQSPCCSRNVDPSGGVIDIALLAPGADQRWSLSARDHARGAWVPRFQDEPLDELLDALCVDNERQFWP